nr:hypothetical protein [Tanacetum cinerariifolium]
MSYLSDFEEINGGYVAFGVNPKGGKISGKGKIRTGKLDFNDVYFVKELKFNIFCVSQMCDKKNNVLFTDTECIVLSPEFKLPDENQVLLRVTRENNMYNVDLKNIVLVSVTKPQNKTPYELLHGRTPSIGFMRPFGYPVTILNTLDPLGKFDGKVDEGFLVGYSNTDDDAAFEVKKPKFDGKKPESEVYVFPSSSALTKKHDDKTKREAKSKSLVELSTRYRNLTLEDITYSDDEENGGVEADFTNLETTIKVSPIPITRVYKDHLVTQIIGDLSLATQTRSMTRVVKDQGRLAKINNEDFHTCMFACFLLQEKPQRVHQALKDPSWIEAMQEKLLQFKMQKVWVLVDLPNGKRAIGYIQEEGIDYEEVFVPVVRIEAIRLFLAYTSFMGFMVYQMDVKSTFLYETIEEEVYVYQPQGFEDPDYLDKVYKVVKALYGLHQAPRACQDRYVAEILRKFGLTDGKSASTLIDTEKLLLKDFDGEDVDVHTYISMIGSLILMRNVDSSTKFNMYLRYLQLMIRAQVGDLSSHTTNLMRNVDSSTKFNMYLRYLQLMIRAQVGDLSSNTTKYLSPALTQKQADDVAAKGATGVDVDAVPAAVEPSIPSPTPTTQPPPPSKELPSTSQVIPTPPPSPIADPSSPPQQQQPSQPTHDAKISLDLLHFNGNMVKKLERKNKPKVSGLKRLRKVGIAQRIESFADTVMDDQEDASKQREIIANIDADEDVILKDVAVVEKTVLSMQDDELEPTELKEVVEVVTTAKLMTEVVTAASATITAATTLITAATITAAPSAARRRKGVLIRDPEETATPSIIIHSEPKSKDKGKGILVEEPKPLKKQAQIE